MAVNYEAPVAAGIGALPMSVSAPVDEIASLVQQLSPETRAIWEKEGSDISLVPADELRRMLWAQASQAYNEAGGSRSFGGETFETHDPLAYYKAFGTVPIVNRGKERYGTGLEFLTPEAGATYTLYSPKSGKTLGSAASPEELAALVQRANLSSKDLSNKTDWQLLQTTPGSAEPRVVASDVFNSDVTGFGKFLGTALPIATSFIPGLGLLGTMAVQGLSGAAGAAIAGRDPIKGGLISGLTAGALKGSGITDALGNAVRGGGSLTNQISSTLARNVAQMGGQGVGSAIGSGVSAGLSGLSDEAIMSVLGSRLGSSAGEALGTAAGGALSSLAGGRGGDVTESPMITATGVRPVATGSLAGMGGIGGVGALGIEAANRALAQQAAQQAAADQNTGKEIVVNVGGGGSALVPAVGFGGLGLAGLGAATSGGGSAAAPIAETFNPEMVVTASPDGGLIIPPAVPSAGLDPGSLMPVAAPLVVSPTTLPTTNPRTVSDYINMIRGGIGVAGGLFGGGGDQGGLPAGFNANTGTVTYTPLNRTQNVTPFDPFTYGQATGERSFFNPYELEYKTNVPSAQTTRTPTFKEGGEAEFDDSIEGHLAAYYSDGGHAGPGPVKGIGSGQEDKIPAWLSDGEYVWSAQDVSDLGDGSSDEGIRRLDKMRQMVRKGAGRKDTKSIARPQKGIEVMIKEVGGAA